MKNYVKGNAKLFLCINHLKVDTLLSLGLDSFGYNTLTIDDYWQLPERDASGRWKTKTNTNNCVIAAAITTN